MHSDGSGADAFAASDRERSSLISDEFEASRQASLASPRRHPDLLPVNVTRLTSPNRWRGVHQLLEDFALYVGADVHQVQEYIDAKEHE